MSGKNTVMLTLAGDESKLTKTFDNVGAAAKRMTDQVDSASKEMRTAGDRFDAMAESSDTAETRFTGFYDTIGGTRDALAALNDDSLSTTDRLVALGQAGADLAGGLTGFVVPALQSMWAGLTGSAAATWVLTAAKTAWAAITGVLTTAMTALNAVIRANPILFIVGLIFVLVSAFIALWQNSEGFRNFFIGMWNGIKNVVGNVVDWIKGVWNGLPGFFRGIVDTIGRVFSAIGGVISGAFKGAINGIISFLNGGISAINGIIRGINNVSGLVGIPAIPQIPKIPKLHTGGVVPGMPGQEVLTVLQAGERVSTSSQGGGVGLVITGSGALYEAVNAGVRSGDIQLVDASGQRVRVA